MKSPMLKVVVLRPGIGIASGVALRFPLLLVYMGGLANLGSDGQDQPCALHLDSGCRGNPVSFAIGCCLRLLAVRRRLKMHPSPTAPRQCQPGKEHTQLKREGGRK